MSLTLLLFHFCFSPLNNRLKYWYVCAMFKYVFLFIISLSITVSSQQDITNRYMLAQNYEQAGEFQKAKEIYEELYQRQPENFQFFDALNRVYIQLKEYDKSISIIGQKINSNPEDINLYGLLGKTHYLNNDERKAFEIWDDALKKSRDNPASFRTMANYAIERRAFDKAIEYLNKGKEISDDNRIFSFDLANIYTLTMRYKDAAREYCSLINAHPNQYQLIESRILSYINKPEALDQTIEIVEEYNKNDIVQFNYLHARLLMEKNELNKAFEIYLEIDSKQNNQGADLYNFANFAYMEKEYELASKVFNEVIKRYPNSPVISSAKLGYAKTMEQALNKKYSEYDDSWKPIYKPPEILSDDIEKVVFAYNELIELYPHTEVAGEALLRIGEIYLNKKEDLSSAEKYFNRLINDYRNSHFIFDAYTGLAEINIINDDLNLAEQNLSDIIGNGRAAEEQKNLARFELAKVKFYSGDFSSAREYLNGVFNNLKDNIANDAIELSLLMNTNMNDSSNLFVYAEAEKLVRQGRHAEASALFNEIASDQQGFMLQHRAKLKEAEIDLTMGKNEESISLLLEISSEKERNIYADRAMFLLGRIYQYGLKDDIKASEMYENLLAKFPNSLYLDEAREEIIKIREKVKQGT